MHRQAVQSSTTAKDRIIIPLDVPTVQAARELIQAIGGIVGFFKVGNQLFTAAGPDIVKEVRASGSKTFLDLKYHDIPNTVRYAVESASALGVDMLTIHLSGGRAMCEAAVAGRGISSVLILGVTVLTSLNNAALSEVGFRGSVQDEVLILAELAKSVGIAGLVASPQELPILRERFGSLFYDGHSRNPPHLVGAGRPETHFDSATGRRIRSRLSGDRPPDHCVDRPEDGSPTDR